MTAPGQSHVGNGRHRAGAVSGPTRPGRPVRRLVGRESGLVDAAAVDAVRPLLALLDAGILLALLDRWERARTATTTTRLAAHDATNRVRNARQRHVDALAREMLDGWVVLSAGTWSSWRTALDDADQADAMVDAAQVAVTVAADELADELATDAWEILPILAMLRATDQAEHDAAVILTESIAWPVLRDDGRPPGWWPLTWHRPDHAEHAAWNEHAWELLACGSFDIDDAPGSPTAGITFTAAPCGEPAPPLRIRRRRLTDRLDDAAEVGASTDVRPEMEVRRYAIGQASGRRGRPPGPSRVTDDLLRGIVHLRRQGHTWAGIARSAGVNERTVRRWTVLARERGLDVNAAPCTGDATSHRPPGETAER